MVGAFDGGQDLGADLESGSFLFLDVLGFEGLGSYEGCFLGFLVVSEGGSDGGEGGSFVIVVSFDLGWLGLV